MKMKGLMCSSSSRAVVCMTTGDGVIVPSRRSSSSLAHAPTSSSSFMMNRRRRPAHNHYNRLIRSPAASIIGKADHDHDHDHEEDDDEKESTLTTSSPTEEEEDHRHRFQVVVLRVSIHCQGCAGKVKKHLSKMEGVTSFSIDLESKRVTVMGHVSAAGVVESISKVKKAELWRHGLTD